MPNEPVLENIEIPKNEYLPAKKSTFDFQKPQKQEESLNNKMIPSLFFSSNRNYKIMPRARISDNRTNLVVTHQFEAMKKSFGNLNLSEQME